MTVLTQQQLFQRQLAHLMTCCKTAPQLVPYCQWKAAVLENKYPEYAGLPLALANALDAEQVPLPAPWPDAMQRLLLWRPSGDR